MFTAFYTALTALNAESSAISIVGNNIANLNTTGFKDSNVEFQDLLYQNLSDGTSQVGLGVTAPISKKIFSQGTLQSTASSLDAAITGQGFFIVKTPSGATEYTRDGTFKTDSTGNLVTANGAYVQGWTATNGVINTNSAIGNLTLPSGQLANANPTKNISLTMNLDSSAANTTQYVSGNSGAQNPATYTTSLQVYDSLGASHLVTLNFWKTSTATSSNPSSWTWQASIPSADGTTSSTGTLQFDQNGNFVTSNSSPATQSISLTGLTDGASNLTFNWNMYTASQPTITQYAETSSVASNTQDGNAPGNVTNISIGTGGLLQASVSTGKQITLGQLSMANFINPDSLTNLGDNDYQADAQSSEPSVGQANLGGRGQITGSTLESSTVDISTEFTKLMTYQNSYEAASRIITVANQITQQTVNLISGTS